MNINGLSSVPDVLVFRTNIDCANEAAAICSFLRESFFVQKCNIALDDTDRVLRVEAGGAVDAPTIIQYLQGKGFFCEELPD